MQFRFVFKEFIVFICVWGCLWRGGSPEEGLRSLQAGAGGVLWSTCLIMWVVELKGWSSARAARAPQRCLSRTPLLILKESNSQGLRKQGQRTWWVDKSKWAITCDLRITILWCVHPAWCACLQGGIEIWTSCGFHRKCQYSSENKVETVSSLKKNEIKAKHWLLAN